MGQISQVQEYYRLLNLKHFKVIYNDDGSVFIDLQGGKRSEIYRAHITDIVDGLQIFKIISRDISDIDELKFFLFNIEQDFYNRDYQEEIKRILKNKGE